MAKTIEFHIPKQMSPEDRGTQIDTHPYKLHPNSTIINFIKKTHANLQEVRHRGNKIFSSVLFLNVLKTPDFLWQILIFDSIQQHYTHWWKI